jgi:cyclic lactone autoinducer peptide
MSKSKVLRILVALVSAVAVFMATASANACIPFFFYQPKAPKSLIKID